MLNALGMLLGGVGIFLLGMRHLTDGLKQSAGEKLDFYLNLWTNTKKRGIRGGDLFAGDRFCECRHSGNGAGGMGGLWE